MSYLDAPASRRVEFLTVNFMLPPLAVAPIGKQRQQLRIAVSASVTVATGRKRLAPAVSLLLRNPTFHRRCQSSHSGSD